MLEIVYKITTREEWGRAEKQGVFNGAAIDLADGYIHLSGKQQVRQTAALHFAGQKELLLVGISADRLGKALVWEPSRGGALFPHLYGPLDLSAVIDVWPLPLGGEGRHEFPPEFPA